MAEDHPDVLPAIVGLAEHIAQERGESWTITGIESAEALGGALRAGPLPCLVISDVELGDGLGHEVMAEWPDIPAVYMTAHTDYQRMLAEREIWPALLKPATLADLRDAIQSALAARRADG